MKKTFILLFLLLSLLATSMYYYSKKSYETNFDRGLDKNDNGNDTNNIYNSGKLAKQGEWLFYAKIDENGLYRNKIDLTQEKKIDTGNISNINVVDEWLYYTKSREKNSVIYWDLYRAKLDGSEKKKLLSNCSYLNIIKGKIYYTVDVDYVGLLEDNKIDFSKNEIGNIYECNLNVEDCKLLVKRENSGFLLVKEEYILYANDMKVYKYDFTSKNNSYIMDFFNKIYLLDNDMYYFNDVNKAIYKYSIENDKFSKIIDLNDNVDEWVIVQNKIFYQNGRGGNIINVINLDDYSVKHISKSGKMYKFDNNVYLLTNKVEILSIGE